MTGVRLVYIPLLLLSLEPQMMTNSTQGGAVYLRSATLVPGEPLPLSQAGRAPELDQLGPTQMGSFVVYTRGDSQHLRQQLLDRGIRVHHYLPQNSWLVSLSGTQAPQLLDLRHRGEVDTILPWHPEWKVAPEWADRDAGEQVSGIIHLLDPSAIPEVVARLDVQGITAGQSSTRGGGRISFTVRVGQIPTLLAEITPLPLVFWVEQRGEVALYNEEAVPLLQSGANLGQTPIHDEGLLGQDQLVGYIDTGLDVDSCFFADGSQPIATNNTQTNLTSPNHRKVHAYDFLWNQDNAADPLDWDNHGHGTHVGGNIGGACEDGPSAAKNGMAPDARFVVQDGGYNGADNCADLPGLGCPVIDLHPPLEQAFAQGARIHTNSWGDNENSPTQYTYSSGSEDVDDVMWNHKDMLLIFAAGNSGPASKTVGSPSTAKNVLAVGGSGNGTTADRVITFSSRGPTADGRIKPDVMAPASNTSAASDKDIETNNCGLDSGAGTSYAAPLVAGAAALVRQYLMEGYYPSGTPRVSDGFEPSGALLKAMLINSGRNMSGATASIPSMDQGWGRVALGDVLSFEGDVEDLVLVDGTRAFTSSGDTPFTVDIQVASSDIPLKVTLVWTDRPSNPAAARNLVNDLDLKVSGNRRVWLGNHMTGGNSTTGGSADRMNNVEEVIISSPRPGTYTVTVSAAQIPFGPQEFALVVRADLAD